MRPHLIALAGPSCAGKGELSAFLSARLEAPILELDAYYRDQSGVDFESRCLVNYDVPEALDTALLFEQAAALAAGRAIDKPVYDFSRHNRSARSERFEPSPFVLLEGLFTLYWPELRALCRTRLFIDAPDEVCLARRIERDTRSRGRTPDEVRQRFFSHVQPAAERYIRPTRPFADLALDGLQPSASNGQKVLDFLSERG